MTSAYERGGGRSAARVAGRVAGDVVGNVAGPPARGPWAGSLPLRYTHATPPTTAAATNRNTRIGPNARPRRVIACEPPEGPSSAAGIVPETYAGGVRGPRPHVGPVDAGRAEP